MAIIKKIIDRFIYLMLETDIELPDSVQEYTRLEDLYEYYGNRSKSNIKKNLIFLHHWL